MEEKIAELEKQIAEIKAQLKEKKENKSKWTPEYGEYYYILDDMLEVREYTYYNQENDAKIVKYNKVFPTKEKAQRYADYLKARYEYSYEFSIEEIDDPTLPKYYIYYEMGEIAFNFSFYLKYAGAIYFKKDYDAEEFINKYEKEILEFEFGIVEE